MRLCTRVLSSLIMILILAACNTNQPRLSLLEPEPIINNNITSAVINLEATAGSRAETQVRLNNTGNNTLSFSLLPEQGSDVQIESSITTSTRVDAGDSENINLSIDCPTEAGNYPTTFTLKSNDVTKPEIIVGVVLNCSY